MASVKKEATNTDEYTTAKPDKQSWSPEEKLLGGNNVKNLGETTAGSLKTAPTLPERRSVEDYQPNQKQPASSAGMEVTRNAPPLGKEATTSAGMATSDEEWLERLQEVQAYVTKHGTIPTEEDNASLYSWLQKQVAANSGGVLTPDRGQVLAYVQVFFGLPQATRNEVKWNVQYERLCQFKKKNGHVCPRKGNCNDKKLLYWVQNQRRHYNKKNLRPDRILKLENLGMVWPVVSTRVESTRHSRRSGPPVRFEEKWNSMYERLCQFKEKNGHVRPSYGNCVDNKLVRWVGTQRSAYKTNDLLPHRLQKLERLGFFLSKYCREDSSHKRQKLLPHRVQILDSLGMVWPGVSTRAEESTHHSSCDGTGTSKRPASNRRIARSTFEGKRAAANALDGSTNAMRKQHGADMSSLVSMIRMTDGLFDGESRVAEQERCVDMACPTNAKPASAENERLGSGKRPANSSSSEEGGACSGLPLPKPKLTGLFGLLENLVSSRRGQSAEHAPLTEEPNSSDMISSTTAVSSGSPESEDAAKRIKTKQRKLVTVNTATNASLDEERTVSISRDDQHIDTKMVGRTVTSEVGLTENVSVLKPSIAVSQEGGSSHGPALNLSVSKTALPASPPKLQSKKTNGKAPSLGISGPIVRTSETIEGRSTSTKRVVAYSTKPQKKHKVAFQSLDRIGRCCSPLPALHAVVASLPQDASWLINPARMDKTIGSSLVGCRVAKFFADGLYWGEVTRHFPAHRNEEGVDLWRIVYEDGGEEDIDETEILRLMKRARGDAV